MIYPGAVSHTCNGCWTAPAGDRFIRLLEKAVFKKIKTYDIFFYFFYWNRYQQVDDPREKYKNQKFN